MNNLKQLGLAAQNYVSSNNVFPPQTSWPTIAANYTLNPVGFAWGFNWYCALFPQMEQTQTFNAINFSLGPMDPSQITAAVIKVSSLLCPSESANYQLFPVTSPSGAVYYYSVSNYVGNYGGPAAIMPYSGTIIPEWDVEQGMTTASGAKLTSIGIQTITDGTSNTVLFSERLLSAYVYNSTATVYPTGINGLCDFYGNLRCGPELRDAREHA